VKDAFREHDVFFIYEGCEKIWRADPIERRSFHLEKLCRQVRWRDLAFTLS